MKKQVRIFISYANELTEHAESIEQFIRTNYPSIEVWLDSRLNYGDKIIESIKKAIDESDLFICLLPNESDRSQWVQKELQMAKEQKKLNIWPFIYDKRLEAKQKSVGLSEDVRALALSFARSFSEYYSVEDLKQILSKRLNQYLADNDTGIDVGQDDTDQFDELTKHGAFKAPNNGNIFVSEQALEPYFETFPPQTRRDLIYLWGIYDKLNFELTLSNRPITNVRTASALAVNNEFEHFYELAASDFNAPENIDGFPIEVKLDIDQTRYFIGGANWSGDDMLPEFLENGYWSQGFGKSIDQIKTVRPKDVLLVKTVSRKAGELWIRAAGVVSENPQDGETLRVDWKRDIETLLENKEVRIPNLSGPYSTTFRELRPEDIPVIMQALFGNDRWPVQYASVSFRGKSTVTAAGTITKISGVRLPGTFTDSTRGADHLNVAKEVKPFASLIASVKQEPPLSIGLFGDWGSGKSFFMRLLKEQIRSIASTASRYKELNGDKEPGFHDRIVQIEFNAWHYIDANLWASMVAHIFANLKLEGEEEKTSHERRKALIEELSSELAKRALRQEELEQLRKEKHEKEASLAVSRIQRDEVLHQKDLMETASIWNFRILWDAVVQSETVQQSQKDINTEMDKLGVSDVVNSMEDVRALHEQIQAGGYRVKNLFNSLFKGPYWWLRLFTLLLVFGVLPILGPYLLKKISNSPSSVSEVMSSISAWLTGAIVWLSAVWKRLDGILSKIEKANKNITDKLEAQRKSRLDELNKGLKDRNEKVEKAETELQKSDIKIEELKTKITNLSPGAQLKNFVHAKVDSDDYQKHFGILSTIRHDFEKLSQLMLNRSIKDQEGLADDYRIDRIVLYIDDLDRCPPDRVVQVLQAVHLLLAFPLFVVVVGVDSRWVSRSLRLHYKSQWTFSEEETTDRYVSPHDYLEKIFQVPYWIKRMNVEETGNYIGKLLGELRESNSGENPEFSDEETADDKPEAPEVSQEPIDTSSQVLESSKKEDGLTDSNPKPHNPFEAFEEQASLSNTLETEEIRFMQRLAPIVNRSPRSTKRFVNIYRIIRASQTVAVQSKNHPEDARPEKYQAIQFLIAILIGQPEQSSAFYSLLSQGQPETKLAGFLEEHQELSNIQQAYKAINEAETLTLTLRDLQTYQDMVARYSFRVGDLDPGNGLDMERN